MPEEDASDTVELDRLERLLWWSAGLSFALLLVLILGEVEGWWSDAGEVAITVVGVLSGLLTLTALVINATKSQVRRVAMGVTDNGRRLGLIHEETQRQTEVLVEIRDRL